MAGQEQTATYPQTVHHLVPMEFAMSLISVLVIMAGLDQTAVFHFVILHVMVLVDAVTVLITAAVTRTGVGGCVIYHQVYRYIMYLLLVVVIIGEVVTHKI